MSDAIDLLGPVTTRVGMGGHQSPVSDTVVWLTPPFILKALGEFDCDPCACSEPRPWPTARTHYPVEVDGLARPWAGRCWVNPPYGPPHVISPWMHRLADHGRGTALIFARTETVMFHQTVWHRATSVLFLLGRLHFHRPDGVRAAANAGAPSCLVAYGSDDAAILKGCGLPGHLVELGPPSNPS